MPNPNPPLIPETHPNLRVKGEIKGDQVTKSGDFLLTPGGG